MHPNGCTGLWTKEFSFVKSVTILMFLPSGFTTEKALFGHGTGWSPFLPVILYCNSAGSLNLSDICLAADMQYGVAFGFRKRCTCSESIGSESSVSLKTFGYLSGISDRVDDSMDSAVGLRNWLFMILSLIKSCQDNSIVCAKFAVTSACVFTFAVVHRTICVDPSTHFSPVCTEQLDVIVFIYI